MLVVPTVWYFFHNSSTNPSSAPPASQTSRRDEERDQRNPGQANSEENERVRPREENVNTNQNQFSQVDNSQTENEVNRETEDQEHCIQVNIKEGERIHQVRINIERDTVLDLKQKAFRQQLQEGKSVRLLFRGQILNDQHPLSFYQLEDGVHLHAIIRNQESNSSNSNPLNSGDLPADQVFFVTSPILLFGITGFVILGFWTLWFLEEKYLSTQGVFFLGIISFFYLSFIWKYYG